MHTHQVIGLNASHARAAGWPAACGAPTRLRVAMAALALASLSTPLALAAPAGVSTGRCEVLASGQLRSNEFVASYEGNCKAGLAQGQGKAVWQLRHAPQAAPVASSPSSAVPLWWAPSHGWNLFRPKTTNQRTMRPQTP